MPLAWRRVLRGFPWDFSRADVGAVRPQTPAPLATADIRVEYRGAAGRNPRRLDRGPPLPKYGNASRTKKTTSTAGGLKGKKRNATACSQTGCSGLAPAPELSPSGAPAAATSPCLGVYEQALHFSQLLPNVLFAELDATELTKKEVEEV